MAIYQTDAEGNCFYVSDKLCQLFDLPREHMLHVGWIDRVHPEDRAHVTQQRVHAISPVKTFSLTYRIIVRGHAKRVEAFSTAQFAGDRFIGRSGVVREVQDRR